MAQKMSAAGLAKMLAVNLADKKIGDAHLKAISESVLNSKFKVRRVDPCIYGICIDYEIPGKINGLDLNSVLNGMPGSIRRVDIFPEGIINPDILRIRVAQSF